MTDDEQAAMDWLDAAIRPASILRDDNRHRATIKRLLARPVMPEEPTMAAVTAIQAVKPTLYYQDCKDIYTKLRAELMKPATKEVTVWHVEYVGRGEPAVYVVRGTRDEAEEHAAAYKRGAAMYVRVTGPHQHVVPA